MKAIICTKYGSPDFLQLREAVKPTPKDNGVLIKIYAAIVNRTDCATLRAKPFFARFVTGIFKPNNSIFGTEFAGDKGFGFNEYSFGAHAEYMTMSEDKALTMIPKNITYEQAAASTEGAYYAYNFINKMNLESGQKVLVNGATGVLVQQ